MQALSFEVAVWCVCLIMYVCLRACVRVRARAVVCACVIFLHVGASGRSPKIKLKLKTHDLEGIAIDERCRSITLLERCADPVEIEGDVEAAALGRNLDGQQTELLLFMASI